MPPPSSRRKVPGIQAAFRLSDPAWQASLRVERSAPDRPGRRVPPVFHRRRHRLRQQPHQLRRLRRARRRLQGRVVRRILQRRVHRQRHPQLAEDGRAATSCNCTRRSAGAYTLLATYERPFKSQGETLAFTGARPLDAQSEQGYTLIISAYQFAGETGGGLVADCSRLDTGEVPPEYRLFFDAPILAAYRYTSRPFDLKLALSPLAQGDSLSLSRGPRHAHQPHLEGGPGPHRRALLCEEPRQPEPAAGAAAGHRVWSASVNGAPVVPVLDASGELIPLPPRAGPDEALIIDLKLAAKSKAPDRVRVSAPVIGAPVLLMDWRVEPDTGQRLVYRGGSLTPEGAPAEVTGFAALGRLFATTRPAPRRSCSRRSVSWPQPWSPGVGPAGGARIVSAPATSAAP